MQSTGQARAHLSQPMQVVRSKRWKPAIARPDRHRLLGVLEVLRERLAAERLDEVPERDVHARRRWSTIARQTFRNHTRIGGTSGTRDTGIISPLPRTGRGSSQYVGKLVDRGLRFGVPIPTRWVIRLPQLGQ